MIAKIEQRHWKKGKRGAAYGCAVAVAVAERIGNRGLVGVAPHSGIFLNGKKIGRIGVVLGWRIRIWDRFGYAPKSCIPVTLWADVIEDAAIEPKEAKAAPGPAAPTAAKIPPPTGFKPFEELTRVEPKPKPVEPMITLRRGPARPEPQGIAVDWPAIQEPATKP